MKPVTLPPGLDRLSTNPAPTGSATLTNTIGTLRVACNNGPKVQAAAGQMTSGAKATSSAAYFGFPRRACRPAIIDHDIAANRPSPTAPTLAETLRCGACASGLSGCGLSAPITAHASALLRARPNGLSPLRRRERDESRRLMSAPRLRAAS